MAVASLAIVVVLTATSLAAVTNPDGFEGYALTTDWNPTEAGEGWTVAAEALAKISTAAALNGSHGLQCGTDADNLAAGQTYWYKTSNADLQTFEMDFQIFYSGAARITVGIGNGTYPQASGAFYLEFSTWDNGGIGAIWNHNGTGYDITNIPGTTNGWIDWANQTWHHLTVEMDFTTHMVRARFNANAWTAWVAMPSWDYDGGGLYLHNIVQMNHDGINYIDNMKLSDDFIPPPPPPPSPPSPPSTTAFGTNPERFEDYASTIDWQPSQGVDGWAISNDSAKIGPGYGQTGQGLELQGGVYAEWFAAYDPTYFESQTFAVDFKNTAPTSSLQRIMFFAGGQYMGSFYDQGPFFVEFYNLPAYDAWFSHWNESTSSYDKTYLPGASDWSVGHVWHRLTVEMDYITHTARAKLNDNAFTAWVHMPEKDHYDIAGLAYSYASITTNVLNGTFNFDNYWLTFAGYDCADAITAGHRLAADFNGDCRVNLVDLALLAAGWLDCIEPGGVGCQTPWSP